MSGQRSMVSMARSSRVESMTAASSCLRLAYVLVATSASLAATATIGRPRNICGNLTSPTSSTSVRTTRTGNMITAAAAAAKAFAPFPDRCILAPSLRPNPCTRRCLRTGWRWGAGLQVCYPAPPPARGHTMSFILFLKVWTARSLGLAWAFLLSGVGSNW